MGDPELENGPATIDPIECAGVAEQATEVLLPVDVIVVIDNSSSMSEEIIEVLEEPDGLKLRVVRAVATADVTGMAGMVKAPARGVPRRLEDFDPAALLTRSRRGRP
jgi:hypothetical protein